MNYSEENIDELCIFFEQLNDQQQLEKAQQVVFELRLTGIVCIQNFMYKCIMSDKTTVFAKSILAGGLLNIETGAPVAVEARKQLGVKAYEFICNMGDKYTLQMHVDHILKLLKFDVNNIVGKEAMRSVILNQSYDEKLRVRLLKTNNAILNLEFRIQLSREFFFDKNNTIASRLLISQDILTLKDDFISVASEISSGILNIAVDEKLRNRDRAEACDTLLKFGTLDQVSEARRILQNELSGSLLTVYENQENVHSINIDKSVLDIFRKLPPPHIDINFTNIKQRLINHPEVDEALERIELDRCIYDGSFSLNDVLLRLFSFIIHCSPHTDELLSRLVEELNDMKGTCSSGYMSRLMNVLSGYHEDLSIRIGEFDQVQARFVAIMNGLVRDLIVFDRPSIFDTDEDVIKLGGREAFYNVIMDEMCERKQSQRVNYAKFFRRMMPEARQILIHDHYQNVDIDGLDTVLIQTMKTLKMT